VALALTTAAAVFGFGRIFADWSFLVPLLVVAATTHVTVALCRRWGRGVGAAAVLAAVQWVLVTTWLFFVDTTFALVPTLDTWRTARFELDRSWEAFQTIVAPAPVQTGFLVAAAAAVAGGAFLADWAAFRLWSAREALVPAVTLFVFATLLADDDHRVVSAVVMVASALAFVLLHRAAQLERSDGWVTGGRAGSARSLVAAGAVLAILAMVVGSLAAPRLPGVDEPPIVDWRGDGGADNARMLTSPLVDIKARLVDTSDTPLFTVEAEAPAYWRTAALDRFDGREWELSATTDQIAEGGLSSDVLRPLGDRTVFQRVTMDQLETYWLPAADRPVRFSSGDFRVRYDRETATLIADDATEEGTTYEVVSVVPSYTADQLRRADRRIPEWVEHALEMPEDFSGLAADLAREVTAGADTDFDRAMALQTFFRETGGFTYSTEVSPGQSTEAIESFLLERVGYCEQFAGTFAAMARSLGIPARVGVGFSWGEQDPNDPTRYEVLGRNAHAWPEVWLGEYGWVPFEPTPGRGNPAAENYTGLAAAQQTEVPPDASTTTTTVAPEDAVTTTTLAADEAEVAVVEDDRPAGATDDVAGGLLRALAVVIAVAAVYGLAVPGGLAVRRRRRRERATTPGSRVELAWQEATESLTAVGLRPRPEETHAEVAARASAALPAAGPVLARLAATADAAVFGPSPTEADAEAAAESATEVDRIVDERLGPRGRLRRRLDPRPLCAGRRARHRAG